MDARISEEELFSRSPLDLDHLRSNLVGHNLLARGEQLEQIWLVFGQCPLDGLKAMLDGRFVELPYFLLRKPLRRQNIAAIDTKPLASKRVYYSRPEPIPIY